MATTTTDITRYLGGYPAAACYSGLSEGTIRRLVESGRLRVYRPTERKTLFDRFELDALIQGSAATVAENNGAAVLRGSGGACGVRCPAGDFPSQ
jgi:excisionase family DNA binding protein